MYTISQGHLPKKQGGTHLKHAVRILLRKKPAWYCFPPFFKKNNITLWKVRNRNDSKRGVLGIRPVTSLPQT